MAIPKAKKRKKPIQRRIKGQIQEPVFENIEKMTGAEFHRKRMYAQEFYRMEKDKTDYKKYIVTWATENNYSKDDLKYIKSNPDFAFNASVGGLARMFSRGVPDEHEHPGIKEFYESMPGLPDEPKPALPWLKDRIQDLIDDGKEIVDKKIEISQTKKKEAPPKSIQERLRDSSLNMIDPIEDHIELYFDENDKWDPTAINITQILRRAECKQAHARIIKKYYEDFSNDYKILVGPKKKECEEWQQVQEAYSHVNKKTANNMIKFHDLINQACDAIIIEQKGNRKPRKTKEKSAEELAKKFKFLKIDNKLGLTSLQPSDIIGANEAWVFNVKTRKIGKYITNNPEPMKLKRPGTGLQIKSNTITGFDEETSEQKTLRKPQDQLIEFGKLGKVGLRKYMDSVKTTGIKLNGRGNENTLILKVM